MGGCQASSSCGTSEDKSTWEDAEPGVMLAFDFAKSTEDNFGVSHFTGCHAQIRPLLDYSYHRKYSPAREAVQDEIVHRFCAATDTCSQDVLPWVVFTAGAMGSGKGYVTEWMDEKGYLPSKDFVTVDPDQIRHALPEWPEYVKRHAQKAGDMTQKEAGLIAEILGYRALSERKNIIFDGSLRDAVWYEQYFAKLRREFPGIRIMILHILADKDEVLKRAAERAEKTGRVVPKETLLQSMEAVPKSVSRLAPLADFVCRVLNRGGKSPELMREPGAPRPHQSIPMTWDLIRQLWNPLDADGDGELSEAELEFGMSIGALTSETVSTIDTNADGRITRKEIEAAEALAKANSRKLWK